VYLYFPSKACWRVWENHPFSIAGSVLEIEGSDSGTTDVAKQGEFIFDLVGSDSDSDCGSGLDVHRGPSLHGNGCYTQLTSLAARGAAGERSFILLKITFSVSSGVSNSPTVMFCDDSSLQAMT
jgi:hypothetical protein